MMMRCGDAKKLTLGGGYICRLDKTPPFAFHIKMNQGTGT